MTASNLIKIASGKKISISRVKSGVYQYSYNVFDWNTFTCKWNDFVNIIKSL